jgi:arylsulfatase A-like enzyme
VKYVLMTLSFIAFLIQNLAAAERPNIVMIFTDDQRHDAVGYAGNDAVHTPTLDRLARQGLIFQNCFVNTSICAISRANLLSGQYPGRHGIDDFHKTFTAEQLRQTVPARLQAAGYQTAFFGKWGIGDSPERTHQGAAVFDYWAGQPMQTCFFHETVLRSNPGALWRKDFLYDHPYGHGGKIPKTVGVRTETHTYTRYIDLTPPLEQLFDLRSDPDQLNNLADYPQHNELLCQLRKRCDALLDECK